MEIDIVEIGTMGWEGYRNTDIPGVRINESEEAVAFMGSEHALVLRGLPTIDDLIKIAVLNHDYRDRKDSRPLQQMFDLEEYLDDQIRMGIAIVVDPIRECMNAILCGRKAQDYKSGIVELQHADTQNRGARKEKQKGV
jgi:hypothetical protein